MKELERKKQNCHHLQMIDFLQIKQKVSTGKLLKLEKLASFLNKS